MGQVNGDLGIENIFLIIIDQLRADYSEHLPKCAKLLPYTGVCETGSIPASTEAMHTNISTGMFPKDHGFISKKAKEGNGLQEIIEKIEVNEIPTLASLGTQYGYNTYVIGCKPETVRVMGAIQDCSLMVYHGKGEFEVQGRRRRSLGNKVKKKFSFDQMQSRGEIDSVLLDMAEYVFENREKGKSFFIWTLPALDVKGHDYGPGSQETQEHLALLDARIASFIEPLTDRSKIIITGDHGCRLTTQYLIEANEKDQRQMSLYVAQDDGFEFQREVRVDVEGRFENIHYDGGILRIWIRDGPLSDRDAAFLSAYGTILGQDADIDDDLRMAYENSKHPNLGNIVVMSNEDATFCKREWVQREIRAKILKKLKLEPLDLPLGEHGTYHLEDRQVYFMSNHNFNVKVLWNTQIRQYISEIMRAK